MSLRIYLLLFCNMCVQYHFLELIRKRWSKLPKASSKSMSYFAFTPILVSEDFEGSFVATVCPSWERHCFKDGSYDHYQSTTVVAPWPAAIAPKFKALGKAQEFPSGKPKVPPCSCTYPGRMEG